MAADGLVIDASAAVGAALVGDGFEAFGRRTIHAPTLLWSESASALAQLVWRSEISRQEADQAVDRILEARMTIHPSADILRDALALAGQLGWARTYDAEYVALARLLGVPLFTLDARLRRGAADVVRTIAGVDLG